MSTIEVDPKLSSPERKQCHALFPNRSPKLHQTGFNCTYKKRLERAHNTASTQRECQKNVRAYSQHSSVQGSRGNAITMAANAKTLLLSLDRDLSLYKSPLDKKIQAEFYSPYSQTSQHLSGGDFSISFVQQKQQNSVAQADAVHSNKAEQFTSSVLRNARSKAKNMLLPACEPSQSGTAEHRQKLGLQVHRLQQNLILDNQMANALNSSDDGDETRTTSATLKKNNRSANKVVSESYQTINVLDQSVVHSKSFLSSRAQQKQSQQKSSVFAKSMDGSSTLLQDQSGQAQNATFAVASADDSSSLTAGTPRTATAATFTPNTSTANSQLLQKKRRELKQLINSLIRRERSRQHGAQQRTYYQDPTLSNTATLLQCQNFQQKNPEVKPQEDQTLRGKSISPMLQISRIQRSPQQQNGANSRRFLSSTPKMYGTSIGYHNSPTRLRDEQQYQNRSANGCTLPMTPAGYYQLQYLRGNSAEQNLSPEQCRYARGHRRLAANKENSGGAESVLNVLPFPFQQFTVQNITILDVHSLIDDGKLERWNAEQCTAGGGTGGDNCSLAMSQASLRNAVEQQWLGNAENDRQDKYPDKKSNTPHRRFAEKSSILSPRKNRKRKYTYHQPNVY